jgi:hypothetical protein
LVARKSLVQRSEIDQAQKSHNCQAIATHRLTPGDRRLKVHADRSHVHYCAECAIKIIEADIAKLQELARQLRSAP